MLREVTRIVGVGPNAAYRHFADRDALLAAVRDEAVGELAQRIADRIGRVRAGPHTPTGARLRGASRGRVLYLEFARTEPGLFDAAFAAAWGHPPTASPPTVGHHRWTCSARARQPGNRRDFLTPARRPNVEYPIWATVHGLAVLLRGHYARRQPGRKPGLEKQTLAFIGASVS